MNTTPFTETEALLKALDVRSLDDEEALVAYVRANFLPNELNKLESACELLINCCVAARR